MFSSHNVHTAAATASHVSAPTQAKPVVNLELPLIHRKDMKLIGPRVIDELIKFFMQKTLSNDVFLRVGEQYQVESADKLYVFHIAHEITLVNLLLDTDQGTVIRKAFLGSRKKEEEFLLPKNRFYRNQDGKWYYLMQHAQHRKYPSKQSETIEYRFGIVNELIGKGSNNRVFALTFVNEDYSLNLTKNKEVVRIGLSDPNWQLSQYFPDLKMKPPISSGENKWTTLRRFDMSLRDFIKKLNAGEIILSPIELYQLIVIIASKVQDMHDKNLAHNDLKPENFLIRFSKKAHEYKVTISDIDLVKPTTNTSKNDRGNKGYSSYFTLLFNYAYGFESDNHATIMIISELLGNVFDMFVKDHKSYVESLVFGQTIDITQIRRLGIMEEDYNCIQEFIRMALLTSARNLAMSSLWPTINFFTDLIKRTQLISEIQRLANTSFSLSHLNANLILDGFFTKKLIGRYFPTETLVNIVDLLEKCVKKTEQLNDCLHGSYSESPSSLINIDLVKTSGTAKLTALICNANDISLSNMDERLFQLMYEEINTILFLAIYARHLTVSSTNDLDHIMNFYLLLYASNDDAIETKKAIMELATDELRDKLKPAVDFDIPNNQQYLQVVTQIHPAVLIDENDFNQDDSVRYHF